MICSKKYRLGFTQKASEIVAEMSLNEKIKLLAGNCNIFASFGMGTKYNIIPYGAGGCKRLGIPEILFCDGPRGVVSGNSTCFPVAMARGATFDTALEERVGNVIGKEVKANGGNFFGGVCINVPYHPGNGRSQEVYGEDPVHMGKMGAALVRGVQTQNVIACIKHFAFNSMEKARFKVNVIADKRTERELYLNQFKYCIDAGAASVMSAYNKYQGEYCGHNSYLLKDVLKNEWDFDGFVISDFFFGLRNTAAGLNGGLDVEMNIRRYYSARKVKKALRTGKASLASIDDSALRIVRTMLAFSATNDRELYDKSILANQAHVALAREVAEKSITLMKNNHNLLPLSTNKNSKIVVAGDLAAIENIGDQGSSRVRPPYIKTFLNALNENYSDLSYDFFPTKKVKQHREKIKNAEAVVVFAGNRHSDEGEYVFTKGGDRKDLGLRKSEIDMINYISSMNKNIIVVLMGGNMIRVNEWHDKVSSILMAYYPGMEGGNAIADIIFGKVNPSGKLPFVVAKSDSDFPDVDWNAKEIKYEYFHGYQKMDKEKLPVDYPFGYGLSYTNFKISQVSIKKSNKTQIDFNIKVTNIGKRDGAEVVQLYIGYLESCVERPERALKDFVRVELNQGESREVNLSVSKLDLAYYDTETDDWKFEDITYIAYVGNDSLSSLNNSLKFRFEE
ncbi:MAG: glycoside hydrolase family 3 C-terminal domain-containing protein [Spirochaetales bacterium]|nr:glycoside hydrolase family 3 C-terminal domain-containing protein [Spirochaetales bacterium]